MGIWGLLGIEPTTDLERIKSAYARQAKLYHPEEHPVEFKALQNAYKTAVRMAKSQRAVKAEVEQPTDMPAAFPPSYKAVEAEPEPPADIPVVSPTPQTERVFDYSGVDVYGDRENFFRQFLLIAKNPYLMNNQIAWDYFLNQKEFRHLFFDTDFRMNFVHTMCGLYGWSRKTLLYFEGYLEQFHTDENRPDNGKWETSLPCFFIRKLPRLRLPIFCRDHFLTKDGAAFQKKLHSQISRSLGRELNYEVRADLIKYMKLYLPYAESKEAYIERLHSGWMSQQVMLNVLAVLIGLIMVVSVVRFVDQKIETENGLVYLRELYGSEFDACSKDKQEIILRNYNRYWGYAEEAIDDVMSRYEGWTSQ
ncbi:MAG: J domain-containing protein [Lachnospiraceae bacterium]|nr:J domain-containing protein [Lachnospiraceae bacterium]